MLGDYVADSLPPALGNAVCFYLTVSCTTITERRELFHERLHKLQWEETGRPWTPVAFIQTVCEDEGVRDLGAFLDFIERAVECAHTTREEPSNRYDHANRKWIRVQRRLVGDIEERLNEMFSRYRFGYELRDGVVLPVMSPLLHTEIVAPALTTIRRSGWDKVEERYAQALRGHRDGNTDKALHDAVSALESGLKACGLHGTTIKELAKELRRSRLVPGYIESVPEQLEGLLKATAAAPRNIESAAHGHAPDKDPSPPALSALAIHLVGAFLVYLDEMDRSQVAATAT